jgi:hypothetical protein
VIEPFLRPLFSFIKVYESDFIGRGGLFGSSSLVKAYPFGILQRKVF